MPVGTIHIFCGDNKVSPMACSTSNALLNKNISAGTATFTACGIDTGFVNIKTYI